MKGYTVRIATCPGYLPGERDYIGLALERPDGSLERLSSPNGHDLLGQVWFLTKVLREMGLEVDERRFDAANSHEGKQFVGLT